MLKINLKKFKKIKIYINFKLIIKILKVLKNAFFNVILITVKKIREKIKINIRAKFKVFIIFSLYLNVVLKKYS